jgi:hypothetical protein
MAYGGRDLIHWGPIWAGIIGAFATMIVLGVLGLAIGLAAWDPSAGPGQLSTLSSIWGGLTMIVAFFVGGWLAIRASPFRSDFPAIITGSIVWALGVTMTLLLVGLGLGPLFGVVVALLQGTNVGPSIVRPGEVVAATQSAAFWTVISLLVGWASAVGGAIVGERTAPPEDVGMY